jgi:hypothetical protein
MNLQEKFNQACAAVSYVLERREKLVDALDKANLDLEENSRHLQRVIKQRDELHAMMSVVPVESSAEAKAKRVRNAHLMEDKQSVFAEIRKIPDKWIAPQGLAILSQVEESTTAAILRRASKLDGIPVEHNGKYGRASKYRWTGNDK